MKLNVEGTEYSLHFHTGRAKLPLSGKVVKEIRATLHKGPCLQHVVIGGRQLACQTLGFVGCAQRSHREKPGISDATGIKLAIRRALEGAKLPRAARKQFWEVYLAYTNPAQAISGPAPQQG